MTKKITLTHDQRVSLNKLWWIFGNNGKKSTLFNHKLIQGFLESGEDRRNDYADTNKNIEERWLEKMGEKFVKERQITQECLDEIEKIIPSTP